MTGRLGGGCRGVSFVNLGMIGKDCVITENNQQAKARKDFSIARHIFFLPCKKTDNASTPGTYRETDSRKRGRKRGTIPARVGIAQSITTFCTNPYARKQLVA
ncbi:MAG: hypothetical protein ACYC1T_00145 [Sulfuricaulis sp.]